MPTTTAFYVIPEKAVPSIIEAAQDPEDMEELFALLKRLTTRKASKFKYPSHDFMHYEGFLDDHRVTLPSRHKAAKALTEAFEGGACWFAFTADNARDFYERVGKVPMDDTTLSRAFPPEWRDRPQLLQAVREARLFLLDGLSAVSKGQLGLLYVDI